ncbi:MAG: SDR family NAD(P)-dependent oxidoreductase [Myxococcota bacterium]
MKATSKAILVTDAERGIGRETALWLGEQGFWVLACGRDLDAMYDLPRETMRGGMVEVADLDTSDADECRRAVSRLEQLYGRADGLVCTGGAGIFGPVEETDEESLRALFDANFYGPWRLIQAVVPLFRDQGRGTIICVSTAAGRIALPMSGAYSATRYALEGLCDALRLELGVFGVDVVLVEPGLVRDRVAPEARFDVGPETLFGVGESSPYRDVATVMTEAYQQLIRRAATPDEVARVIERALAASRPRARYAVSRGTAALLWARKLLPDRLLDSRLVKAMGLDE